MKSFFLLLTAVGMLAQGDGLGAEPLTLQSSSKQVSLLELYTSEGCSSCPPAERWLSGLKRDPGLWKNFVPIAFHVNYWDNLGWPDKYASPDFTARQRNYAASWGTATVYTPELVDKGREGSVGSAPGIPATDAGILKGSLNDQRNLTVQYIPAGDGKKWEAHVASLGFDLNTAVKAGENGGRTLQHDFTVLSLKSKELNKGETVISLGTAKPGEKGLALWITETGKLTPVQATGGWIK